MNAPNESHPRFLCRVIRAWSAVAGDPSSGVAARHAGHCPACQEYFAASSTLDARLRAAAPRHAQPLPAGFEQRLEHALARANRAPTMPESGSRWVVWSLAGSLAAAAVLTFVLLRPTEVRPALGETPVANSSEQVPPPTLVASAPSSGAVLLETIDANPLEREIDHVYSDARAALQFLALNFLPASVTTAAPSS
jgi:hypothetical protein